jgi:hypothetical protein
LCDGKDKTAQSIEIYGHKQVSKLAEKKTGQKNYHRHNQRFIIITVMTIVRLDGLSSGFCFFALPYSRQLALEVTLKLIFETDINRPYGGFNSNSQGDCGKILGEKNYTPFKLMNCR